MTRLQKVLWAAVAVAVIAAGGLAVYGSRAPEVATDTASSVSAAFELTDHDGVVRTSEDFRCK